MRKQIHFTEGARDLVAALQANGWKVGVVSGGFKNNHHKSESLFKATGRALREAVTLNPEIHGVNSTKGVL